VSGGRQGWRGPRAPIQICARASRHQLCSFRVIIRLATSSNDDGNKMVQLRDVQGRVYKFKSKSECLGLGMLTLDVTDVVRSHMVLVLDVVLGKLDHVKVMTVGA
jgi:hypothetical protein